MKITILVVFVMTVAVQGYQSYRTSEYNSPMPYSFAWDVNDYASKNNYAHSESSNGKAVTGSYRVALPDGRTQIVTYRADHNGYVADVKYEGEAKYPEYRPTPSYSFPAYQAPARSYSAPAYRAPAYATYSAPAYAAPVDFSGDHHHEHDEQSLRLKFWLQNREKETQMAVKVTSGQLKSN